MRDVLAINAPPAPHWVGDGFPVRSLLSHYAHGAAVSPFLLLDHAGPRHFDATSERRGVGAHPHKGFETVTIVYDGEVEHRDSTGAGGVIGPGDVQWMTAGAGIVHEERHSAAYARSGGPFEMVQLWVNLPKRHKQAAAGYQALTAGEIPVVALPGGTLRVIAGSYGGANGPARTFTPLNVWDVRLNRDAAVSLDIPEGHTAIVVVLAGTVEIDGRAIVREAQSVVLGRSGGPVGIEANGEAKLLVLSGEPIDEPVVAHGPFVMNTEAEIREAVRDYSAGRLGTLEPQVPA
ncbi:MAG: pirin family protein [Hyphomicrobiaceae bacterium]